MAAWLVHHRGKMRAGPDEVLAAAARLRRLQRLGATPCPARSADQHESLSIGILLTPLQRSFLNAVIVAGKLALPDYVFRLPSEGRRCSLASAPALSFSIIGEGQGGAGERNPGGGYAPTLRERAFVEAVVVHCLHKLLQTEEGVVKATNDQLRGIMRARHGLEMDDRQFGRLKQKFITRPGKPAGRFELMRETAQGKRTAHGGIPSEYELTGLGWLFSREEGCGRMGPAIRRGVGGESTYGGCRRSLGPIRDRTGMSYANLDFIESEYLIDVYEMMREFAHVDIRDRNSISIWLKDHLFSLYERRLPHRQYLPQDSLSLAGAKPPGCSSAWRRRPPSWRRCPSLFKLEAPPDWGDCWLAEQHAAGWGLPTIARAVGCSYTARRLRAAGASRSGRPARRCGPATPAAHASGCW